MHYGMSDRWAGRTALRRSWLQFEAVEFPVRSPTVDTALHHCGQRARSSVRERGREGSRQARRRRECSGLAALRLPSGRRAGPDWPGTINWLRANALDAIRAVSSVAIVRPVPRLAMTK